MKTAKTEYVKKLKEARELLAKIEANLTKYEATNANINYGHVGDIGYLCNALNETNWTK